MITGFPSPAQGYEDNKFDLNTLFIKHPSATVFMTVDTDRYSGMCIFNGDLLIIDRAKKITDNSLVVYESGGEFVIGRVCSIKGEALVTGAIVHVIHTVKEV
jgi:DNA polymerase V